MLSGHQRLSECQGLSVFNCAIASEARQSLRRRERRSGNEIATWFDKLTMSGCAPRDDKLGTRENAKPFDRRFRPYAILTYALAEVVEMVDTRS